MRIIRFIDPDGTIRLGQPRDDGAADLLDGDLYDALEPTGKRCEIGRLLAPLDPCNVFCIGLNYRSHASESGFEVPTQPVVFMKPTSAVCGPHDDILIPAACAHGPEVDYEAEIAVVIGTAARNVSEDEALDHVLGYTCANDVSARKWQMHAGANQWIRGKSFDRFCPLGPALLTRDEIPDPQALTVRTLLNGKVMQEQSSAEMIFPVRTLISELSRDLTLLPGTVILSGTPEGVGFARKPPVFLQPGDEVIIEIPPIGRLTNRVRAAGG